MLGHISRGKGVEKLSSHIVTTVSDQVNLDKAGLRIVPIGKGADWNLMLEQAARFWPACRCRLSFWVADPLLLFLCRNGPHRAGDQSPQAV